jgi:hypothetical protein
MAGGGVANGGLLSGSILLLIAGGCLFFCMIFRMKN